MAGAISSPSGFSYAQAAKGRSTAVAPQSTSSKVTTGTTTPATSSFTELTTGGNWADDVEASVIDKTSHAHISPPEQSKPVQAKDSAMDRTKTERKMQNTVSGVSSPDLVASSSTTTKDDDDSSAPTNGSSESTWETKSQGSDPQWVQERSQRQASSQDSEKTATGGKKSKDTSISVPPTLLVLQDAAPPAVNPWMKRAEERAKLTAQQTVPKSVPSTPSAEVTPLKENQRPRADSNRKKASSIAAIPRSAEPPFDAGAEARMSTGSQGKRANEARATSYNQSSKPYADAATPSGSGRTAPQTRSSLPNLAAAPPSVKDEVSWPTPDTVQERERKELSEKDASEKQPEEPTPTAKPHKKREWQSMVVTPNIIFETPNIKGRDSRTAPGSDRGGRNSMRGRGGYRGSASHLSGGDRQSRVNSSQSEEDNQGLSRGRSDSVDRDAMPPPPKPNRASSANSLQKQAHDSRQERSVRGQSLTEIRSFKAGKVEKPSEERKINGTWKDSHIPIPRTVSPVKINGVMPEVPDDEHVPEPIPRKASAGTQTDVNAEQGENAAREGPQVRVAHSDGRKDHRGFEHGTRDTNFNTPSRGNKRSGRGRGGSREFTNGGHGGLAYPNGEFSAASSFTGVPPSPSAFQRGTHQFSGPPQGRGGWARSTPRSQSIATDGYYGRFGPPYGQQLGSIQTYLPGMYEYSGYPMTAIHYSPYMEQQVTMDMISMQLEYYFSIDNLLKDMFLRRNMDSKGFVLLEVITNFNRMRPYSTDKDLLRTVCLNSEAIEIVIGEDGKDRLRRREGWEQFLLPMDQREASAQNDGPTQLQHPERPTLPSFSQTPQLRGPASATVPGTQPRFDRRSYDTGNAIPVNGVSPNFAGYHATSEGTYGEILNGDDARGRPTKSPLRDNIVPSVQHPQADANEAKDSDPDAFPDEQANQLTVVVKMVRDAVPHHHAASRTFSNGSIDSRNIFTEMEKATEKLSALETNGEAIQNGIDSAAPLPPLASPNKAQSLDRADGAPNVIIKWVKDQITTIPSGGQPEGLTAEAYWSLRHKALDQRDHAATGTCPYDLDVLYQFWAHFLLRNFNSRMYGEFKFFATEDGRQRHNFTGLENLLKFYDLSLLSQHEMRDRLVSDYVNLVNTEPSEFGGMAFKQLRAAWRNGALNLKNRKKLADIIDESLKHRLEG